MFCIIVNNCGKHPYRSEKIERFKAEVCTLGDDVPFTSRAFVAHDKKWRLMLFNDGLIDYKLFLQLVSSVSPLRTRVRSAGKRMLGEKKI